jgi:hypothetical protein
MPVRTCQRVSPGVDGSRVADTAEKQNRLCTETIQILDDPMQSRLAVAGWLRPLHVRRGLGRRWATPSAPPFDGHEDARQQHEDIGQDDHHRVDRDRLLGHVSGYRTKGNRSVAEAIEVLTIDRWWKSGRVKRELDQIMLVDLGGNLVARLDESLAKGWDDFPHRFVVSHRADLDSS